MGRYDKIRYWNGSTWVQPNRVRVWTGSAWQDYGTNDSSNTNSIYVWDGSSWKRKTLNKTLTGYTNGYVNVNSGAYVGITFNNQYNHVPWAGSYFDVWCWITSAPTEADCLIGNATVITGQNNNSGAGIGFRSGGLVRSFSIKGTTWYSCGNTAAPLNTLTKYTFYRGSGNTWQFKINDSIKQTRTDVSFSTPTQNLYMGTKINCYVRRVTAYGYRGGNWLHGNWNFETAANGATSLSSGTTASLLNRSVVSTAVYSWT